MSCSNFNPNLASTSASNVAADVENEDGSQGQSDGEQAKKSVTILISDTGEITYDEKTLQSIIGNVNNIRWRIYRSIILTNS